MDQRPSEARRSNREFLVVLFVGGALVVVGCLLPFSEFVMAIAPFPEGNDTTVSGYETDSGKVLLGMGVVLLACAYAIGRARPEVMKLAAALALAVAAGAALITVSAFTGGSPPVIEGFGGFAAGRPAVGYYFALVGSFLALASAAVLALQVLRER